MLQSTFKHLKQRPLPVDFTVTVSDINGYLIFFSIKFIVKQVFEWQTYSLNYRRTPIKTSQRIQKNQTYCLPQSCDKMAIQFQLKQRSKQIQIIVHFIYLLFYCIYTTELLESVASKNSGRLSPIQRMLRSLRLNKLI